MTTGAKLCSAIYWLALTLWVGVLVAAAVAAATTFTVLPKLGLTIESFGALPSVEHGRIAAGKVMEPIFTFVDIGQAVTGGIVLLMVLLQSFVFRVSLRRVANVVRVTAIVIAAGLFAWRAAALTPGMNRELRAYWSAAEAGDAPGASTHRAAFNEMHPVASDLFSATLALLVIAVVASPAALNVPARPATPRLETPALARSA